MDNLYLKFILKQALEKICNVQNKQKKNRSSAADLS